MDFSKLTIEGLSKQDAKTVQDNPNASIEELMALGLTDKGVTRLNEFAASIQPFKAPPLKPTSVRQGFNVPQPKKHGIPIRNRRTGQTVHVSQKAASKLTGRLNKDRTMGSNYGKNYSA